MRFRHLKRLGVDVVERKDGIRIELADYELDMHMGDALSQYATVHEELCTEFAFELLDRADRQDLVDAAGPTKSEFTDHLDEGVAERQFEELF